MDPSPAVYYRVDVGNQQIVPTTYLDNDDQGKYEFRMVSADEGRLVCVYELTRAAKNEFLILIYDASTQESWPRAWSNSGGYLEQVADMWRERYRRLRAENPDLPKSSLFKE